MKIVTHFMQTLFGKDGGKIRVQYIDESCSTVMLTVLVNDCVDDNIKCDVKKVEEMAGKHNLPFICEQKGDYSCAIIVLTKEKIRELAEHCKLPYGWTAIDHDLNSNAGFLFNLEAHGISIDLGVPCSDFQ